MRGRNVEMVKVYYQLTSCYKDLLFKAFNQEIADSIKVC